MPEPAFPQRRLRRLRRGQRLRDAVADVTLTPGQLVYPLFVGDMPEPRPVAAMPGIAQLPVDAAVQTMRDLAGRGVTQFLLFGVTGAEHKDAHGSYAASPDAPVNRTLQAVRDAGLDVLLYADLCFCEYTDHGHCGALIDGGHPPADPLTVDNDRTLDLLGQTAVAQARAGADIVAPSGMMDGQVAAIRRALDAAGHPHTPILSYAIKYASSFYGPFREAGEGGMQFGDRRGYQMDYRRGREWRAELDADLAEGADMVMVKPAMAYLDVLRQVRDACDVPVLAYHVSGEFAMLHAAAARGWLDLKPAVLESTTAIRRAGADAVVTYFAPQLAEWLG
ncbi:MAG: porphobilinogen synthase [Phycisphaeraceae bacterium]